MQVYSCFSQTVSWTVFMTVSTSVFHVVQQRGWQQVSCGQQS
jgi:hypothetical protein